MFGYKVYFSDRFHNCVRCWDPDTGDAGVVVDETELRGPYGLSMDSNGKLLVADKYNNRICRMKDGKLEKIHTYDPDGSRKGKFPNWQDNPLSPTGLFIRNGIFVVAYSDDNTIYRIGGDGKLEHVIGIPPNKYSIFSDFIDHAPPEKAADTLVRMPTAVVLTREGTYFFIERGYQAVRRYHPNNGLETIFPIALKKKWGHISQAPEETDVDSYWSPYPTGLALSENEKTLFLSDMFHRCAFEIDLEGGKMKRITKTPPELTWNGKGPAAVALGKDGTLWVGDTEQSCIYGYRKQENRWEQLEAVYRIPEGKASCGTSGGTGMVCG